MYANKLLKPFVENLLKKAGRSDKFMLKKHVMEK